MKSSKSANWDQPFICRSDGIQFDDAQISMLKVRILVQHCSSDQTKAGWFRYSRCVCLHDYCAIFCFDNLIITLHYYSRTISRDFAVNAQLFGTAMTEFGDTMEKKGQKMEVDYSAAVDKKIPQCEALAAVICGLTLPRCYCG